MGGDRKFLRIGGGGTVMENIEGVGYPALAGWCGRPCLPAMFNGLERPHWKTDQGQELVTVKSWSRETVKASFSSS